MDIIDQAIEFELKGHKFYLDQAEKATSKAVKEILCNLAEDELEHADFLKLLKKQQVQDFVPTKSMHKIKDIIKESALNEPDFLAKDAQVLDVLKHALEIEDKARNHYSSEAVDAFDDNTKRLLNLLSLEEEKHYNLISNLIKYIDAPSNLLETQEFQFYDD